MANIVFQVRLICGSFSEIEVYKIYQEKRCEMRVCNIVIICIVFIICQVRGQRIEPDSSVVTNRVSTTNNYDGVRKYIHQGQTLEEALAKRQAEKEAKRFVFLADEIVTGGKFTRNYFGAIERLHIFSSHSNFESSEAYGERERTVREVLGTERYEALCDVLIKQLDEAPCNEQHEAISGLGLIGCLRAEDRIKTRVFSKDYSGQINGLMALVELGVPGSDGLLISALLAGAVPDYKVKAAIDPLIRSGNRFVVGVAPDVLKRYPTALTATALLPAYRKRGDYKDQIIEMFIGNISDISNVSTPFSLAELATMSLKSELLNLIELEYDAFSGNEQVVKEILKCANDNELMGIYTRALLMLEKSGRDVEFFKKMYSSTSLSEQKRSVLEKIINRNQESTL